MENYQQSFEPEIEAWVSDSGNRVVQYTGILQEDSGVFCVSKETWQKLTTYFYECDLADGSGEQDA